MSELPGETGPHRVLVQCVSGHSQAHRARSRHQKEPVVLGTALLRASPGAVPPGPPTLSGHRPLRSHCWGSLPAPPPQDQQKSHSCPQGAVSAIYSSHQGLPRKSINDIPRETQDGVRAVAGMGPSWPPQAGCLAQLPPESRSPCGGWPSVGLGGVCSHAARRSGRSAARVGGLCSVHPQQRGALGVAATGPGSSADLLPLSPGSLRPLVPLRAQQGGPEAPQGSLYREKATPGRVGHHEGHPADGRRHPGTPTGPGGWAALLTTVRVGPWAQHRSQLHGLGVPHKEGGTEPSVDRGIQPVIVTALLFGVSEGQGPAGGNPSR